MLYLRNLLYAQTLGVIKPRLILYLRVSLSTRNLLYAQTLSVIKPRVILYLRVSLYVCVCTHTIHTNAYKD